MRSGTSPSQAAQESLDHITRYYPNYSGALIAVDINGSYGEMGEYTCIYQLFDMF